MKQDGHNWGLPTSLSEGRRDTTTSKPFLFIPNLRKAAGNQTWGLISTAPNSEDAFILLRHPTPTHDLPAQPLLQFNIGRPGGREMNHIIVDMRFNQVIRAEPRASAGWVSLNTKQAWGRSRKMEKSFMAQLGAGEQGRGVPGPLCELLSCDQHVVCAAPRVPLRGLGRPLTRGWEDRGVDRGRDRTPSYASLEVTPRPVTSSAQTALGYPSQHHPGIQTADRRGP